MSDSYITSHAFQTFLNVELSKALERFDHEEAAVYIYCHLSPAYEPSRRVLVVTEANSARIAVCIEAAYELFEGDIHHYVRQIGTIARSEAATKLRLLVSEAHEIVLAWKPTFANIEDNVFLPN